jgi:tetratricopeptide (TPR) repeat protein
MNSTELLRKAIEAARNGRELTARDLFKDVVRLDPNNEVAWMWLSGLLDPLEDRITACERVLSINPENHRIRAYYEKLLRQRLGERQEKMNELDQKVLQIRSFIDAGKQKEALFFLQNFLREETSHKEAWRMFAELSASITDKVRAYEAIVQIDPADIPARESLNRFRYFERHPLELAAQYEEEGNLDEALRLYEILAAEAGDSPEFEDIYKNIVRLEDAKVENVRHIKPAVTILRMSLGVPLLYLLEIFIQEGLNPIRHPAPVLWLGIPVIALGSFLMTVASVRVQHSIWRKWFGDRQGRGSETLRSLVTVVGLILILAPHLSLALDSYFRLQSFQIPAIPWIR